MEKISKMVYEAPFIEVVPMLGENVMEKLSGVDYGHGEGTNPIGDHDPEGMGKEFGFQEYEDLEGEKWGLDW
ncbi:MAG: hypothetical protein IKT22_07870 [Prevotella sp.]|nr:hypothetical protein [Muribaculaceae bacterium]MBR6445250.1 hypothetical protein [Prevotella sp.]MBR6495156.1 hypothetical protein [Prevotella sp.]